MSWTQEMVDHLTTRWREQTSASELARELSEMTGQSITRNAVVGKVHRLGLTGQGEKPSYTRQSQDKGDRRPRAAKAAARAATVSAFAAALEPVKIEPPPSPPAWASGGVPLFPEGPAALPMTACRWPLWGEVRTGMVCGATCKDGKPYCVDHCRIAYRPPAERKAGEKKRVAA